MFCFSLVIVVISWTIPLNPKIQIFYSTMLPKPHKKQHKCWKLAFYQIENNFMWKTLVWPSFHPPNSRSHVSSSFRRCPICMLDFVVGQPIRLLPCMHYYHMRCIDDWLMRSLTCPTCMERVDVGVRNTVLSSHSLRRRRVGSSSSTNSTVSTISSSSMEHLLTGAERRGGLGHRQGPQLQLLTSTTPSGGQHQQTRNEMQQQGLPQSPIISSVNPMTLNLEQVSMNTNVEVHPWSSQGGFSPPGSPLQAEARGHTGGSPSSPPLIEYHYEFLPMPASPTKPSNSAH